MYAIETQLPADPLLLASRLWHEPGAALLWSADASGSGFLTCWPQARVNGLDPEPELDLLTSTEGQWGRVPRWLGILPYEAERERMERPLYRKVEQREAPHHTEACWWRYGAVAVIGRRVTVVGDERAAVQALARRLNHPAAGPLTVRLSQRDSAESPELHRARIARALHFIREGEIYQVNVARRLTFEFEGGLLELLGRMSRWASAPYCCALKEAGVVSTSPELLLHTGRQGRALTVPIKGTRPRGTDAPSDEALLHSLATDAKEHAELAMVVDIERSDLARVSRVGSVVALEPRIRRHSHVFHREARVSATLTPGLNREQLLRAMLPSGSITGAPKVRAMELIAELEAARRGLYTGALGYVAQDGGLHLSMAIRALTCRQGEAHYYVGGGIVADSDPDRELEETEWKSVQVTRLLGAS